MIASLNPNLSEEEHSEIFKDYITKINQKIQSEFCSSEDINSLIILLNWCFKMKNNFFIEDFNTKMIIHVYKSYNQIKSNILTDCKDLTKEPEIFDGLDIQKKRILKFILSRFISKYNKISEENPQLTSVVTKNNIKNCLTYLNTL